MNRHRALTYSAHSRDSAVSQESPIVGFLDHLSDGALVIDDECIIRAANSRATALLDQPVTALIGRDARALDGGLSIITDAPPPQTLVFRLPSGTLRTLRVSVAPFALPAMDALETDPDSSAPLSILLLYDDSLAHRLARLQTEFIATASHQLRTPLASIITAIGLLTEHSPPDFPLELTRLHNTIRVSSARMERLVNNLIELTNTQSGRVQMHIGSVDVRRLIATVTATVATRLAAKDQHLHTPLPSASVFIQADEVRVGHVLAHLIGNAGKFSAPGADIRLYVDTTAVGWVVFRVEDTGIGIAPDDHDLIFEPFYQGQVVENVAEFGTGLGLPLAKVLVELNGGRIWFESVPDVGSTFYVSLPRIDLAFDMAVTADRPNNEGTV